MRPRHAVVLFLLVMLGLFAAINWATIAAPTTLNLVVGQVQGPLGLLLLGVVAALSVVYALMLVVTERRLLREHADTHRALEAERRRTSEAQSEEMRQVFRELSSVRMALGQLAAQRGDRAPATVRRDGSERAVHDGVQSDAGGADYAVEAQAQPFRRSID